MPPTITVASARASRSGREFGPPMASQIAATTTSRINAPPANSIQQGARSQPRRGPCGASTDGRLAASGQHGSSGGDRDQTARFMAAAPVRVQAAAPRNRPTPASICCSLSSRAIGAMIASAVRVTAASRFFQSRSRFAM